MSTPRRGREIVARRAVGLRSAMAPIAQDRARHARRAPR
jgi:hypothetical protein